MATSITMNQTNQGKQKTRSVTNINPNATDEQLGTLAKSLNALTTNTLGSVNRIDKTEIDPNVVYSPVTAAWKEDPGEHLTLNGLTVTFDNQATIDEAGLLFYCEGVLLDINGYNVREANPRADRFYFGYYWENSKLGLSIAAYTDQTITDAEVEVAFAGGSVEKDGTTYYYAPFTVKFVQRGA